MVDANQAWNLEQATAMLAALTPLKLGWLEEPLRADRPWHEWLQLREQCSIPLAAGENILGHDAFEAALHNRALDVVQPDVAKWGGISGCWPVIQRIRETGLRFCPHFLGAGLGLMASAHVLAAAGGDGMLEVDSNDNVLRSLLAPPFQQVQDGWIDLGDEPGMGVVPELAVIQRACP
jgi:L-alanine-DL-glutamate epimerase-like enolase superfamily enzyme